MHRAIAVANLLFLAVCAHGAESEYVRDIGKWQEVAAPAESDEGARMVWLHAANGCDCEWRVFIKDGQPHAQLSNESRPGQPGFTVEAGRFRKPSAFVAVDDGWLAGFNQGEFGGALYWFSRDGGRSYSVSSHQVVEFFTLKGGLHAIAERTTMDTPEGSVIRIARPNAGARWAAIPVMNLPSGPLTVALRHDGTMLVTLWDSLISIGTDLTIQTIHPHAPWRLLYPSSSVLSKSEQKLYLGMRQFVGEFDMATKRLRFLIPSSKFLNKLPEDHEERIRRQYGG